MLLFATTGQTVIAEGEENEGTPSQTVTVKLEFFSYGLYNGNWEPYSVPVTYSNLTVGTGLNGIEFPVTTPACPVEGGTFEGWYLAVFDQSKGEYTLGTKLEEYTVSADATSLQIVPKFSKGFKLVTSYYVGENGTNSIYYVMENYTKDGAADHLKNTYGSKFPSSLGFTEYKLESVSPNQVCFVPNMTKKVLTVYYNSFELYSDGVASKTFEVEENLLDEEMKKKALEEAPKNLNVEGLNVTWDAENISNNSGATTVVISPKVDHPVVIYRLWNGSEHTENRYQICQVGETISSNLEGYSLRGAGKTDGKTMMDLGLEGPYTAETYIYVLTYQKVNEASGSQNADSSDDSSDDSTPASTDGKLDSAVVSSNVEKIAAAKAAGEAAAPVTVNMGSATVVPVEILEAVKGSDVDVVLQMDGYSWTINGNDVTAANLVEINLEVKRNENAIPAETVKAVAGNHKTMGISLTHNGDFGFRATLKLDVGAESANQWGNLYYYNPDGKLVFMYAGRIAADGSVNLNFSHASDYVVVIGENQTPTAPKTGDVGSYMLLLAVVLVTAGGFAVKAQRSKKTA